MCVAILLESIEGVASSFYEGMFAELSEQCEIERAHEMLLVHR